LEMMLQSPHRIQLLIGLSLMTFATLYLHGVCKSNSPLPSTSTPQVAHHDSSSRTSSNSGSPDQLVALEASIDKLVLSIDKLHEIINHRPQQHVWTESDTMIVSSTLPVMLWAVGFFTFMEGASKVSIMFMMNTMLASFLCANLGMGYMVFGNGDDGLRWYSYVLGILWSMQGAMAVSIFIGDSSRGGEVTTPHEGRKKD
jgi:hypothetical protein